MIPCPHFSLLEEWLTVQSGRWLTTCHAGEAAPQATFVALFVHLAGRRQEAAEDRCARGVSNNRIVERERRLLRRLERFLPGNVDHVGQY
jgi:hypothetical protein